MVIIIFSSIFTDTNVDNIEEIDKNLLPISILHTKNFSHLENLMNHFVDASITKEEDTLLKTQGIKDKLIKNLDLLAQKNVDVENLKILLDTYYTQAYKVTSEILDDSININLEEVRLFQLNSEKIFFEYQNSKDKSNTALLNSLDTIADTSKSFFQNSLIISLLGFFCLLGIGVLIYININNRFNSILESVKNLSIEKPDFALVLNDTNKDELSELTGLFQKISTKLESTNTVLQREVKIAVQKTILHEQELIRQSKSAQMGEMLSMIAHQWRQPLNVINSIGMRLYFMAEKEELSSKQVMNMTDEIETCTEHMSTTIDDFRNFFQPEKEKVQTSYEIIIKSVLTLIEASLQHKNIEIIIEKYDNSSFKTYQNELIQVVLNIIKNAEDAFLENKIINPRITISMNHNNGSHLLEIQDNAGGIDSKIITKIFDPYFSTKNKLEGTGLGLYMSKTIINEHCKGSISVKNNNDGVVFSIELS